MSTNRSSADSDSSVRAGILANVPSLRAFAISLSGNVDRADDLVQETLLRALAKIDSFEPGTNLPAWLFKILRNAFLTEYRKRRREVEDSNGQHAQTLKTYPEQHSHVDFKELQQALGKLPASQRNQSSFCRSCPRAERRRFGSRRRYSLALSWAQTIASCR